MYEKPGFEGDFLEIDSEIFSFSESDVDESENLNFKSIGSLKILGGLWVFTLFLKKFLFCKNNNANGVIHFHVDCRPAAG